MAKSREKGGKTKLQNEKKLDFSPNSESRSQIAIDFCFLIFHHFCRHRSHSYVSILHVHVPFPFPHVPFPFLFPLYLFHSPLSHLTLTLLFFSSCLRNVFPRLLIPPILFVYPYFALHLFHCLSPSFPLSTPLYRGLSLFCLPLLQGLSLLTFR